MDETIVQVLKEPGRAATAQSYLWVQRGGPPATPLVLYDYAPTRSASVAVRLLDDYAGWLQSDGYEAYASAAKHRPIRLLGCFAHARRKFDEALKAQGKPPHKTGHAAQGMAYIQKLYRIEQAIKAEPPAVRLMTRQQQAQPILAAMREWLDTALHQVAPGSLTGKALHYLHQQWHKLIRYVEDGRLSIDNNACENAIRPFVIGRKGWLFCDTVAGAKASANLYSLVETAKANGLEPYAYLRRVFTELPKAQTLEDMSYSQNWCMSRG
jgi:transposase